MYSPMKRVKSFMNYVFLGLLIRISLVLFSKYHDSNPKNIPYTDIDYRVFTDAAFHTIHDETHSPYARLTYRYSPLLAYIMIPNHYIGNEFGKIVFVLFDMLCGWLLTQLAILDFTQLRNGRISAAVRNRWHRKITHVIGIGWYLNPMIIAISTRGSSESIVLAQILAVLYLIRSNRVWAAAIIYGLSVHWRIYPIIYSVSLEFALLLIYYKSRKACWNWLTFPTLSFLIFALLTLGSFYL